IRLAQLVIGGLIVLSERQAVGSERQSVGFFASRHAVVFVQRAGEVEHARHSRQERWLCEQKIRHHWPLIHSRSRRLPNCGPIGSHCSLVIDSGGSQPFTTVYGGLRRFIPAFPTIPHWSTCCVSYMQHA